MAVLKIDNFSQEFNVTGSSRVNDEGILAFLGLASFPNSGEFTDPSALNPVASSLMFAKMRSTGVRVAGVRLLLSFATSLQGLRCSNYDVLQVKKRLIRKQQTFWVLSFFFQGLAIHLKKWSEMEEDKVQNGGGGKANKRGKFSLI